MLPSISFSKAGRCIISTIAVLATVAQSRFIIGELVVPFVDPQIVAFPIDICLNYRIDLKGFSPDNKFGKFECNQAGDEVTLVEYGTDSDCKAENMGQSSVWSNSSASKATIGYFKCSGDDNYVMVDTCTIQELADPQPSEGDDGGKDKCCDSKVCLAQTFATGICVKFTSDQGTAYQKMECDGRKVIQPVYATADCTGESTGTLSTNLRNECSYFDRQVIVDVYRRMIGCYEANTLIRSDNYCAFDPTADPTLNPTGTTDYPTSNPTDDPTFSYSPTVDPTSSPVTESSAHGYFFMECVALVVIALYFVN